MIKIHKTKHIFFFLWENYLDVVAFCEGISSIAKGT